MAISERPPNYYDANGQSLFYNEGFVSRSLSSLRLFKTRSLHIGSIQDLKLIDVSTSLYPDIPAPCYALENYIRTTIPGTDTPAYIFDDHNHALFAWYEAFYEGRITPGAALVHIDDHDDSAARNVLKPKHTLLDVYNLSTSLDNNMFIHPAIKDRLVSEMYWVWSLHGQSTCPVYDPPADYKIGYYRTNLKDIRNMLIQANAANIILDIDIDYLNGIGNSKTEEDVMKDIRFLYTFASVVTFAISPEHYKAPKALEKLKLLLS